MGVNYKLGADVGSFKQGMQEAQASLRTLDAALKANESSLKAGGNAQLYMEQKTRLLNDKMQQQKKMADQLQDAMKKMRENGVSPTSVEYQRLHQQLLQAQSGMNETKVAIDGLTTSEKEASGEASQLATNVSNIGKKVSLDAVIGGIDKITGALQTAAKMAVSLGASLWDDIMDTARLSDDYGTMASRYGLDVETLQKQLKVFDTMAETSIEAYHKARMKILTTITSPTDEQMGILESLGLVQRTAGKWDGTDDVRIMVENAEDALWEVGQRLKQKVKSGELDRDKADLFANALFGRGFAELNPLFDMGKDAFNEAVEQQSAATEKAIENNAALADSVTQLQKNYETFKIEVLGAIAPELTKVTDSLSNLLNRFTEYAKSDEGQALLKSMGEAVEALLKDLTNIDPEDALKSFVGVFNGLKESLEWLYDHSGDVINAMKVIVAGWAGLKLTGGALQIWQMINGISNLNGLNAPTSPVGNAAMAGTATGTDLMGIIYSIAIKAMNGVGNFAMSNFPMIADYWTNNTRTGQEIRNTGDVVGAIQTVWNEKTQEVLKNVSTFAEDWKGVFDNVTGWFEGHVANGKELQDKVVDYASSLLKKWADEHSASNSSILGKPGQLIEEWNALFGQNGDTVDIPAEPVLEPDAAEKLQEQVSGLTVQIGARIVPVSFGGGAGGGGGGKFGYLAMHANGIWSVPFDGYPAILHRGERVVPEREVSSQSYNSNLYVEKMYMNNGTDVEGLASGMAAAQRRRMRGYGN